eukprot:TRINITY_DN14885_c0_g1_i1.p1 TRINITY_DN14885_c0_g1~~TRINITY_DN14885_c0_g1_i1.p1  ORF type:complete len:329 (+),score=76.41 TRINITY_DN14885_c0_g1_i1:279-1265(+)
MDGKEIAVPPAAPSTPFAASDASAEALTPPPPNSGGPGKQKSGSKSGGEKGSAREQSSTLTTFTVQCATCYKWRKVPSLDLYEDIRAHVSKRPFYCEQTAQWPDSEARTCDSPPDLVQDGTLLWAMDRHDIPKPPPNWRRRIVVRGGSTNNKFSDVYYHSPCGKSLRSVNDVEKFLGEHPEYKQQGVTLKMFSFTSPRAMPSDLPTGPLPAAPPGGGTKRGAAATPPLAPPAKRPIEPRESGAQPPLAQGPTPAAASPDGAAAAAPPLAAPEPPAAQAQPPVPSASASLPEPVLLPAKEAPASSDALGAPSSTEGAPRHDGAAKEEPS